MEKITKPLTATFFTFLIAFFISYRAGYLDNLLNINMATEPAIHIETDTVTDTFPVKRDSVNRDSLPRLMFPSTKLVVITSGPKKRKDTSARIPDTSQNSKENKKVPVIMGSSKSGEIVKPLHDTMPVKKSSSSQKKKNR